MEIDRQDVQRRVAAGTQLVDVMPKAPCRLKRLEG